MLEDAEVEMATAVLVGDAEAEMATAVPVRDADSVVEIVETEAVVGNAGREDPEGRVTQRLGRGTSNSVVTAVGVAPKDL